MDAELLAEFDKTVALVKKARRELEKEPMIIGQRGGAHLSPWGIILRDQQGHLIRVSKLLTARNQEVPLKDDALAELLD